MANPVIENILANVATTLGGITTLAGYNQSLTVERLSPGTGDRKTNNLAVVYLEQLRRSTGEEEDTQSETQWLADIVVELTGAVGTAGTTPMDQTLLKLWADCYKAMMADGTRGGYALSTWVADPEIFVDDNVSVGIVRALFTVRFQHARHNPYTI